MAQKPRTPPPLPSSRYDSPELRDPSEGLPPAIRSGQLTETSETTYPPPEPVQTIADEQRERSAYIESIGVDAYKDEIDNRDEEERAGKPQVEGVTVVKTGGGTFKDRPAIGPGGTLR